MAAVGAWRPGVVHAFHAFRTGPIGLRLARRLEVPLVVTMTGTDANHALLDPERAPVVRRVLEGATVVTMFDGSIGERVSGVLPDIRGRLVDGAPGRALRGGRRVRPRLALAAARRADPLRAPGGHPSGEGAAAAPAAVRPGGRRRPACAAGLRRPRPRPGRGRGARPRTGGPALGAPPRAGRARRDAVGARRRRRRAQLLAVRGGHGELRCWRRWRWAAPCSPQTFRATGRWSSTKSPDCCSRRRRAGGRRAAPGRGPRAAGTAGRGRARAGRGAAGRRSARSRAISASTAG